MSAYFVPTRFTWHFGGQVVSFAELSVAMLDSAVPPVGCNSQVHLCGSFTRWVETVPMATDDTAPGVFAVVVHLPPGCVHACNRHGTDQQVTAHSDTVELKRYWHMHMFYSLSATLHAAKCFTAYLALCRYHQYKFIVDGEWRHDETQPFMPDPLGNVNNWLFVRRPEQTQNQG